MKGLGVRVMIIHAVHVVHKVHAVHPSALYNLRIEKGVCNSPLPPTANCQQIGEATI